MAINIANLGGNYPRLDPTHAAARAEEGQNRKFLLPVRASVAVPARAYNLHHIRIDEIETQMQNQNLCENVSVVSRLAGICVGKHFVEPHILDSSVAAQLNTPTSKPILSPKGHGLPSLIKRRSSRVQERSGHARPYARYRKSNTRKEGAAQQPIEAPKALPVLSQRQRNSCASSNLNNSAPNMQQKQKQDLLNCESAHWTVSSSDNQRPFSSTRQDNSILPPQLRYTRNKHYAAHYQQLKQLNAHKFGEQAGRHERYHVPNIRHQFDPQNQ